MSSQLESCLEMPKRTPPKYNLLNKKEPESSSSSESPLEVSKPKTPTSLLSWRRRSLSDDCSTTVSHGVLKFRRHAQCKESKYIEAEPRCTKCHCCGQWKGA